MTNDQLLKAYVNGETSGHNSNHSLSIDGNKLYSYRTCIARRASEAMYITTEKYSVITSRHTGRLVYLATLEGYSIGNATHDELNNNDNPTD